MEAAPAAAPAPAREPVEILARRERRRRARAAKAPASARGADSAGAPGRARRAARAQGRRAAHRTRQGACRQAGERELADVAIEHAVGRPKSRQGIVVSDKADKTITVRVDTSRRHRRYKKIVRLSKTLHAVHDEGNEAHEGDLVVVVETRPLSATKRWRLTEVLERAK